MTSCKIHVWDNSHMTSDVFGAFLIHLPTYPNQILYYISLFSKIRCSLTYLLTYLKIWCHMWTLTFSQSYVMWFHSFSLSRLSFSICMYIYILLSICKLFHKFIENWFGIQKKKAFLKKNSQLNKAKLNLVKLKTGSVRAGN